MPGSVVQAVDVRARDADPEHTGPGDLRPFSFAVITGMCHMDKVMRIIRIVAILALLAITAVLLFTRLGGLICTLIGSAMAAYLLNKPLRWIEKRIRRHWALLLIFGLLAGAAFFFFYFAVPLFFRQAADFVAYVPKVMQTISELMAAAGNSAGEPMDSILNDAFAGLNKRVAEWLGSATINLAQGSYSSLGWGLLLPVFTFYFLKDREYFVDQVGYLVPIRYKDDLHALYCSIDKSLGQFMRGQLLVAFSVALMSSAGLLLIGVPNALLLGLICGLCNMIPFIGPFIGAVPVALVSIALGWKAMLVSVLVVFVVQQIDNTVISPKIIGDSLRIHPAYIIIAIIAGSGLFGVIGLLLAMPALIILKEIIVFAFRKRLYGNRNGPGGVEQKNEQNNA